MTPEKIFFNQNTFQLNSWQWFKNYLPMGQNCLNYSISNASSSWLNPTIPSSFLSFNNFNSTSNSNLSLNMNTSIISSSSSSIDTSGFDTFNLSTGKSSDNRISLASYKKAKVDLNYKNMTKSQAEAIADINLEKLKGGSNWSICSNSFINDIPYAAKGINPFLDALTEELDITLTVTSALGTKNSPHAPGGHYDPLNPKLDFGGGLSHSEANELKAKLDSTGYFEFVNIETHGNTAHLDVKIKDNVLAQYA
ncbi:hypothetical protein IKB17_04680 [bacterium]|nr:hypothetical protein [bacterium]